MAEASFSFVLPTSLYLGNHYQCIVIKKLFWCLQKTDSKNYELRYNIMENCLHGLVSSLPLLSKQSENPWLLEYLNMDVLDSQIYASLILFDLLRYIKLLTSSPRLFVWNEAKPWQFCSIYAVLLFYCFW